jgi:hypothetical protein
MHAHINEEKWERQKTLMKVVVLGLGWDWGHLVCRPLPGLLHCISPGWWLIISVEQWLERVTGDTEVLSVALPNTNSTSLELHWNLGRRGGKMATDPPHLSHDRKESNYKININSNNDRSQYMNKQANKTQERLTCVYKWCEREQQR